MSDQLPANPLSDFVKSAQETYTPVKSGGSYLTFSGKRGEWELGMEKSDVEGRTAIIRVQSWKHGWCVWVDQTPSETLVPVNQPVPVQPESRTDSKGKTCNWDRCLQIDGRFNDDEDGNEMFQFTTSSFGGTRALDTVWEAIVARAASGSPYMFPCVMFATESYDGQYGRNYNPVFDIVSWHDEEGNPEADGLPPGSEDDDEEPEAKAPPKRGRRRRRAA